jgi:Ni,Fe-hydrogenase maturation factor
LIERNRISAVSFSTHRLSLLMLTEYLEGNAQCSTLVLGIQPGRVGVMEPMSRPVVKAVDSVGRLIADAIREAVGITERNETKGTRNNTDQ